MKNKNYLILSIFFLVFINACAGYEPIFKTTNINFKISEYIIEGNKTLGNKIYSKLHNLTKSQKNQENSKSISIIIESSKNKKETTKDSSGKVLEYRITLNTKIEIREYLTENKILNQTFNSSIIYKVQDQYSDTIKLENKSIDDLIEKTYQELIIRISESI
jgi:hypothetical protein